jgi:hypothetical protein
MTHMPLDNDAAALGELRRYRGMFDSAWTLVTALATALVVLCWYLRLAQIDVGAILWSLATLSLTQFLLNSWARRVVSPHRLRLITLISQLFGTALLGITWHLFGGLQQPVFPLLVALPLVPGALLLAFWQQQLA